MKKLLSILSFIGIITLYLFTPGLNTQAETDGSAIISQANAIAEDYGFIPVESLEEYSNGMLEFDTLDEFERFLAEQEQVLESDLTTVEMDLDFSTMVHDDGPYTLTYKFESTSGFETITAYARVTRDASGYIMGEVDVWSIQTGFDWFIEWTENYAYYTTHNNNRNGTGIVEGTRYYHVSIGGFPIGYKRATTIEVPF